MLISHRHKHKHTSTKHTQNTPILRVCSYIVKVDLCAVKIIASAIMQLVSIETKSSQSCSLRLRSHCGSSRSCGSDAYWFLLILSLVYPHTRTDMHNIYSENSGASATKVFELVTGIIYEDLANTLHRALILNIIYISLYLLRVYAYTMLLCTVF